MSRINDALKRAQQNQSAPSKPSQPSRPLELKMVQEPEPIANQPKPGSSRLIPVLAVLLVVAAVAVVSWTVRNHSIRTITDAPPAAAASEPVSATVATPKAASVAAPIAAPVSAPVVSAGHAPEESSATAPVEGDSTPLISPKEAPKLQGIVYTPGKSSAIIDGKSVRAGDKLLQYRVKEISQSSVTLVDSKGKTIKLGMGN
jgi:hypothetical protein